MGWGRQPSPARVAFVVPAATLAFALALALRDRASLWWTTGAAGAISIVLAGHCCGSSLRQAFVPSLRRTAQGVFGSLLLTAGTWGAYASVQQDVPWLTEQVQHLYTLLAAPPGPKAAIPLLTLAVVGEECVWRGALYPALAQHMNRPVAVGAATVLYALPQAGSGSWLLVTVALGCGALWTLQREWTNGLLVPTITHLGWSLCLFVLVPLEGAAPLW